MTSLSVGVNVLGGTATVVWDFLPGPVPTDWIGLYRVDADNTAYVDWWFVSCGKIAGSAAAANGSCELPLPAAAGTYEFRLLASATYSLRARSSSFTVAPPAPTATSSPTATPGGSSAPVSPPAPTSTSSPTTTPTPTDTPVVLVPVPGQTVLPVVLTTVPTNIPTPNRSEGGLVVGIPSASAGNDAVAVIRPGPGSAFGVSLVVSAPTSGGTPVAVRLQPATALTTPVSLPPGADVREVVAIDVFNPTNGEITHVHAKPLELTLQIPAAFLNEGGICATDPGRISLIRIESGGSVVRVPALRLDCVRGLLMARLSSTSEHALVLLRRSTDIPLKGFVPVGLLRRSP